MSREAVGFGLIGAGSIAAQHAQGIAATPGARLVAVASRSAESSRLVGEAWGADWYTDLEAMLRRPDLDAAVILTPSGLHAEHALLALRHGKHVVIEKPLALTLESADAVLNESRARGLMVATISQRRFEPVMQAVHAAVSGGALGAIALVEGSVRFYRGQEYYDSADWRGTVGLDGGALMNQGIHMVDLVRWIMGEPVSVSGHVTTRAHRMEAEDVATASIRFGSGALGTIVATTCAYPGFDQELRIFGEKGYIHVAGQAAVAWQVPRIAAPGTGPVSQTASGASDPRAIGSEGHARQYADMTGAIQERRAPAITGEHGRAALELVLAVYESARTGRAVEPGKEGTR